MTDHNQITTYDKSTSVEINSLNIIGSDGKSWSLKGMFINVTIFEDMFQAFTSGFVIMSDAQDYINRIPIDGWQQLVVEFRSNTNNIFRYWNKSFKIHKISDVQRAPNAGASRIYRLDFVSSPMEFHLNNRLSRSYTTFTESEIVEDICTNILKIKSSDLVVEKSKYTKNFVVPNWKPLSVIRYCCQTAIRGTGYESANYMFFESFNKWNFVSLDYLMAQQALPNSITTSIVTQLNKTEKESPLRQAEKLQGRAHSDFIHNSEGGMFAKQMIGIDIFSKQYKTTNYVYNQEFDNQPNIDSNGNRKVTSNALDNPLQVITIAPWQSQPRGMNSDHNDKFMHKRAGMMAVWNNISFDATIGGDTSLEVGQKVNLGLIEGNAFEANSVQDKSLSGSYLITAIRHDFNAQTHKQVLNLRKGQLKK